MSINLPEILCLIENVELNRSGALCSRLADKFEDDLLEHDELPEEHFSFFLKLLTDAKYFRKPGIWNFVLAVNNVKDALAETQLKNFGNIFLANFQNYQDSDLCLAVCDFVARNMQPSAAAELLEKFKRLEAEKPLRLQGIADEGLFILSQEARRAENRSDSV